MKPSRASVLRVVVVLSALLLCTAVFGRTRPPRGNPDKERQRAKEMDASGRWTQPDAATVVEPQWWAIFGDQELSRLIDQAIADNIDLRILTYRIDQAELGVRSARQGGLPQFSADIGGNASFASLGGLSTTTRQYDGGINVGWEADIWGKLRREKEATAAEVRATEADWRAGYLILVHEVARSYFGLRTLEEQMEIHGRALGWAKEALNVYERQLANGLITRDAVTAQSAEVLRLEREIDELQRQRDVEINNLAVLLGKMPGSLAIEPGALRNRVKLPKVDTGVSANLLERRPDVVAADERLLEAYRITEARRAARLPTLTSGGSASITGGFGNPTSFFASFLPQDLVPLPQSPDQDQRQARQGRPRGGARSLYPDGAARGAGDRERDHRRSLAPLAARHRAPAPRAARSLVERRRHPAQGRHGDAPRGAGGESIAAARRAAGAPALQFRAARYGAALQQPGRRLVSAMLKIYHVPGTRSIRVIWLCEELRIPYQTVRVDFSPEYRSSPEWRALNPVGKVPVLPSTTSRCSSPAPWSSTFSIGIGRRRSSPSAPRANTRSICSGAGSRRRLSPARSARS